MTLVLNDDVRQILTMTDCFATLEGLSTIWDEACSQCTPPEKLGIKDIIRFSV